jgi:hypothetical protein
MKIPGFAVVFLAVEQNAAQQFVDRSGQLRQLIPLADFAATRAGLPNVGSN